MLKSRFLLWGQTLIERGAWYLAPISWIWGFVAFCKNALYDRKLLPIHRVPRPIVSIGNLVAGGTGKTPLVLLLASQFPHRKIAILSRGYGEYPDEAELLERRLKTVSVYFGKNRVRLAKQAMRAGAQLIILDDGFQHRKLHRDFDLLLLSASDPFGKGHYLPRGFLRDSPKRMRQADAVFLSGKGDVSFPHIGLEVVPERMLDFMGKPVKVPPGTPIGIFCGIGKPASFKKTMVSLGLKIVSEWILADHQRAPEKLIRSFADKSKSLGAKVLICTEKDYVKLDEEMRCSLPLYFLEISLRVSSGQKEWENLIAKIDQKIDNITAYE